MANEPIDREGGDVRVTIVVTPGPVRRRAAVLLPRTAMRLALAAMALTAVLAAGLVTWPGSGPALVAHRPGTASAPSADGVAAAFGIRSHCERRALYSKDGTFARVDFDRSTICGAAGNHVTLIFRRVRRAWVAAFDASGGVCPANALPRAVLSELHLCPDRIRPVS